MPVTTAGAPPGTTAGTPPGGAPPRDRGAADAVAVALLAPVFVGLAVLVIFLGRQVDSRAQVRTAAEAAAQAAALARDPAGAEQAATATAAAMLVDPDGCADPVVAVDLGSFAPGGTVAVTVTCGVSDRGLGLLPAPERRFSATATAAIDPHRAVP